MTHKLVRRPYFYLCVVEYVVLQVWLVDGCEVWSHCVDMCAHLINGRQWPPTILVMCSDQCYKQDVKGLPSVAFLNYRPLVPVDGWKWSDINDHVSCRPVARRNQRRSVQPPTTISRLEPACLPFVITRSLGPPGHPPLNTCWTCLSIYTEWCLIWKSMQCLMADLLLFLGILIFFPCLLLIRNWHQIYKTVTESHEFSITRSLIYITCCVSEKSWMISCA